MTNCSSILLDTTYFAVDFVTCPCSYWTKRHDNLFVYDDDDDDDDDELHNNYETFAFN